MHSYLHRETGPNKRDKKEKRDKKDQKDKRDKKQTHFRDS